MTQPALGGIPHLIDDYSATRDVFTQALPALTGILVLELVGAFAVRALYLASRAHAGG